MLSISACSTFEGGTVEDIPRSAPEKGGSTQDTGKIFGEDGLSVRKLIEPGEGTNNLPVNKFLWRAALDTLSFLPIASVDTFSGVIATDWGAAPGSANERVRATAYVRSAELTAQALDVTVYREVLGGSGVWQTAPVDPATAEKLEDAILTRARQLRIEDVDS